MHTCTRRWSLFSTLAFLTLAIGLSTGSALAQCRDDSEGSATHVWTQNQNGAAFNFSHWAGGIKRNIQMADPTILKLKDSTGQTWFFVTGTTDWFVNGSGNTHYVNAVNFPIFRSTNLRDWYFHSWVFDPTLRGANWWDNDIMRIMHPNGQYRYFKHLWSPQLYYDPTDGSGTIYCTFGAAELKDNDLNDNGLQDEDLDWNGSKAASEPTSPTNVRDFLSTQQSSCMVAWTDKANFLAGGVWASQTFRNSLPALYGYQVNNSGAYAMDGGAAQQAAIGGYAGIPTTGNTHEALRYKAGQYYCGNAVKVTFGFHWACVGPREWMGDAPLVFFDPNNSCKPWMTWTWVQRGPLSADQNNVGAFPFKPGAHWATYNLMNAQYANPNFGGQTQSLQLFFSWNNNNGMSGIPNGQIIANSTNMTLPMQWVPADTGTAAGVAEGQDVFYYNNRYYAVATRNPYDSPAYQIVYRKSAANETNFQNMHLPWSLSTPPVNAAENVLIASDWVRDVAGGRQTAVRTNFGHSQFFTAYGRAYIIFHKMLDVNTKERRVFFKELTFNPTTGDIARIWESYPYQDLHVNWFKAPNVAGLATAPVP